MTPLRANRCGFVWGIDPGGRAAHTAVINTRTGQYQTNSVQWGTKGVNFGRHLMDCHAHVSTFTAALAEAFPPVFVVMEQPTGRFPNPRLMMATGVIAATVGTVLALPVNLIAVASWRKAIGVGGGASKEQVVAWARERGWGTDVVDQAEALGVAVAGAGLWGIELPRLRPMVELGEAA